MNQTIDRPSVHSLAQQPPQPAKAIPAAIQELSRAQAHITGYASELVKRLQPVLLVEPPTQSPGSAPQSSTACGLADQIVSEVNAIDRVADALCKLLNDLAF